MNQLNPSIIKTGSILTCIQWPKCPNKPRPVLVLQKTDSIDGKILVLVAYGTGQRTQEKNSSLNKYEVEISSADAHAHRLSESTKFDISNVAILELNAKNFSIFQSYLKREILEKVIEIYEQCKQNNVYQKVLQS